MQALALALQLLAHLWRDTEERCCLPLLAGLEIPQARLPTHLSGAVSALVHALRHHILLQRHETLQTQRCEAEVRRMLAQALRVPPKLVEAVLGAQRRLRQQQTAVIQRGARAGPGVHLVSAPKWNRMAAMNSEITAS